MKLIRSLIADRWPLIGLSLVTTLIVVWAGLTVRSVFTPQPQPPEASRPEASPVPSLPKWLKAPISPLAAPVPIPNPIASLPSSALTPSAPTVRSLTPKAQAPIISRTNPLPQSRYGHLPYAEDSQDRLVPVGTYGEGEYKRTEYLDQEAANAFDQMVAAARAEGVSIIPISGFRNYPDQAKLFERQIQRQGSEALAAQLSAPAGYSEHHTGYALDVGDGNRPNTDVKFEFEETAAYQWMATHAKRYNFELSFPRNNAQGVSFEPWHWRFVGSGVAAAKFSVAHTLQQ